MELAGTRLPVILDCAHLFGAFMFTSLLNLAFGDHACAMQSPLFKAATRGAAPSCFAAKSPLRFAA